MSFATLSRWDLQYPVLYLAITGIASVFALVWRRLARGRVDRDVDRHSIRDHDMAFLAGGAARVADTVLAALLEQGRIEVGSDGRVWVSSSPDVDGNDVRDDDPVVDCVLDGLRRGHSRSSAVEALRRPDAPLVAMEGSLVERGLVVAPERRRRARIPTYVMFAVAAGGIPLFVLLSAFGGGLEFAPASVLGLSCVGAFSIAVTLGDTPVRASATGRRVVKAMRTDVNALRAVRPAGGGKAPKTATLMAVACLGLTALEPSAARTALLKSIRGSGTHDAEFASDVWNSPTGCATDGCGGHDGCGGCGCGGCGCD
ncbi:TIGR04222 domain-containing membrane protein [Embleya sp. NPDC059237]|uniref:TIGR04222 domain-containing membrane protein n=1 Tax=Embleya sp. NPDC059237 TaxID=3346784 RepID=UPI003698749F